MSDCFRFSSDTYLPSVDSLDSNSFIDSFRDNEIVYFMNQSLLEAKRRLLLDARFSDIRLNFESNQVLELTEQDKVFILTRLGFSSIYLEQGSSLIDILIAKLVSILTISSDLSDVFWGEQELVKIKSNGVDYLSLEGQSKNGTEVFGRLLKKDNLSQGNNLMKKMKNAYQLLIKLGHIDGVESPVDHISFYQSDGSVGVEGIMTKLIPGVTLSEFMKGASSLLEKIKIIKSLLAVLFKVNSMNVVHNNLTPDNIIVSPKKLSVFNYSQIMPIDDLFGEKRALMLEKKKEEEAKSKNEVTLVNFLSAEDLSIPSLEIDYSQAKDCPEYIAPERVSMFSGTQEKYDHRSDLYSVGIILFEMVMGHPPFVLDKNIPIFKKNAELYKVLGSHLNIDPIYLNGEDLKASSFLGEIIKGFLQDSSCGGFGEARSLAVNLFSIIEKALDKNPKKRFKSAGDFAVALAILLK